MLFSAFQREKASNKSQWKMPGFYQSFRGTVSACSQHRIYPGGILDLIKGSEGVRGK